jgi:guanine deaminase
MPTVRLIILLAALAVSGYAVYNAGAKVKSLARHQDEMMRWQRSLTKADYSFMYRAVELSKMKVGKDELAGSGSVVVIGNKIIGEGLNRVQILNDPSAHAEVEAVRQACESMSTELLQNASIYISAKPCSMCLSLIYFAGIEKIFYRSPVNDSTQLNRNVAGISDVMRLPQHERPIPEIPVRIDGGLNH